MIETIIGDLLLAPNKYIVHQTNCVSEGKAAGLAYYLFNKFPHADCYKNRSEPSIPGTLDIRGDGLNTRFVVNLMGQYLPGSSWGDTQGDAPEDRKFYFHRCLSRLAKIDNLVSVAFPYKIGCGIAGGDWDWYYNNICKFAEHVKNKQQAEVVIYQRPEDV
jgi:O-acetyl-ADP-ribose deacetylase (regulator of RNase III)